MAGRGSLRRSAYYSRSLVILERWAEGSHKDCHPPQHREKFWELNTVSGPVAELMFYSSFLFAWDSYPQRVGQRPVEHTVRHCLGCAFHWLLRENKFLPHLLGNSSSLSNWQRKKFISIVSNILKDSVCHVDFSGTVSVIKQCSR